MKRKDTAPASQRIAATVAGARARECVCVAGWLAGWAFLFILNFFVVLRIVVFRQVLHVYIYIYGVNDDGNECNVSIKSERQTTTL